jgi:peptidoglycan hydrolase-like protein with peptidoglycan-binding domain
MHRGAADIPKLTIDQNRDLQQNLTRMGYDVGRADGVLGLKSRTAIREVQIKFNMPADGWPTADLLERTRRGR